MTERKSLESERSELIEFIASRRQYQIDPDLRDDLITRVQSLRRLAARDQKPLWIYEDDLPDGYPYDAMFDRSEIRNGVRMFPVYLSPPPAAGWDALDRLHKSATDKLRDTSQLMSNPPQNSAIWDLRNEIKKEIQALRHNAPPEEPTIGGTGFCGHGVMGAVCEKCKAALPPHGGADAGVREVLRRVVVELEAMRALCALMIFEPDHGKPHPLKDGVYDKRMQAAYDVINAAEATLSHQPSLAPSVSKIIDEMAKRWIDGKWDKAFREDCERLVGAAKTNASAEARLREALERIEYGIDIRLNDYLCEMKPDYDDSITGFNEAWDIVRKFLKDKIAALSTHPHASDCDKQGETAEHWLKSPAICEILERRPSDCTADVKCEACFGTGRHMGRFSMNDPDCTYCRGKGKIRAPDCDKQGER